MFEQPVVEHRGDLLQCLRWEFSKSSSQLGFEERDLTCWVAGHAKQLVDWLVEWSGQRREVSGIDLLDSVVLEFVDLSDGYPGVAAELVDGQPAGNAGPFEQLPQR